MINKVVDILIKRKITIATAESCTGGMVISRIIDVPGTSDIVGVSFVTYSNEAKMKYLGVSEEILEKFTEVSEETAREMLLGLKKETGCGIAVATTGIAGPTGGTKDKPVGLVYTGVMYNDSLFIEKDVYEGDRFQVRKQATDRVFEMIYKILN